MRSHTESALRKSFINCSKGAAQRINFPKEILNADSADWEKQIFLSWADPKAPQRAYLVAETTEGLQGLLMERNQTPAKGGGARMCQLCFTLHPSSGVSMVSIPTTKSSQDKYGSIGTYICSDLQCVAYALGKKKPEGIRQMEETLTVDEKIERMLANVKGIFAHVDELLKK
ncbi:FBP domain-containing protein [Neomicrococcus aestuarii]|uniref:Elongation factor G-binding protein C-terminal treble-clef zinc-finger domain-containing protein n=1 Tax=Neomicrococcus aestuarii TaxID=556325 RepID=A0A1L2ZNN1_9MICC|nr:FBP domain-containing protein [Neomicrococcus aestuarii]APF40746.1 hypothetical protein BHE16_06685 [Neomicrococcus aestuarii]